MAKPKTVRQRYVAGLEAIGYVRVADRLIKRYLVYRHPYRERLMYVGAARALRTGINVSSSVPCSELFKQYVLSAPEERMVVYAALDDDPRGGMTSREIARDLVDKIATPPRFIEFHVRAWLKEREAK